MLQKSELFARLAVGHAARITVVTPNQRLAHSLTLEFDDYQLARGSRRGKRLTSCPSAPSSSDCGRTRSIRIWATSSHCC